MTRSNHIRGAIWRLPLPNPVRKVLLSIPWTGPLGGFLAPATGPEPSPDPANDIAVFLSDAKMWQDVGKTVPAYPGDLVEVIEVKGGDLIREGGTRATRTATGGLKFANDGTRYRSVLATGGIFSLYVDLDPDTSGDPNIVVCSSSAPVGTFLQAYAFDSAFRTNAAVGYPTGGLAQAADEPVERVRGMVANGSSVVSFAGPVETAATLGVGAINTLQLGSNNPDFYCKHTINAVVLRNVADDAAMRQKYKLWMGRRAAKARFGVAVVLHTEGGEPLSGADANAILACQALHDGVPLTLTAAPSTFAALGAATAAARIRALLRPTDELALHTHFKQAAVTASGVTPRLVENFESASVDSDDDGYNVLASSYTRGELTQYLNYWLNIIEANNLPRPRTYLAPGYLLDADNRLSLVDAGITRDLSQVPPALTATAYNGAGYGFLQGKLETEYAGITPTSRPTSAGGLLRIPSTGAVYDYAATPVSDNRARVSKQIIASRHGQWCWDVEGIHVGATELGLISAHLTWIKAYCAERGVTPRFVRANEITA